MKKFNLIIYKMIILERIGVVISLLLIGMVFFSCKGNEEPTPHKEDTFVTFSTRVQGSIPSLNRDVDNYEDFVASVRLIVCDKISGEVKYNLKHSIEDFVNHSRKIAIKPGSYEFYFIANETSEMTTVLNTITFRDALYYSPILTRVPYGDVNTRPSRNQFLMTAIYQGDVTAAHTINNALPLEINLIRTLAKVSLTVAREISAGQILGTAKDLRINKIVVNNIPETYALFPIAIPYDGVMKPISQELNFTADYSSTNVVVLRTAFYIPEYLRANTTVNEENTSLTFTYAKHGITRVSNTVINHGNFAQEQNGYYTPENTAALSTFSVVRNTDYKLDVKLKGWEEEMVNYDWEILPWNTSFSEKDFSEIHIVNNSDISDQPGIEHDQDDGRILYIHSGAAASLKLKFKVRKPLGGVWRFTITNTLDFKLEGTPFTAGIASEDEILLTITPLKPWSGGIRSTELYLTVNGVEVQIVKSLINANEKRVGPTFRYMIQQIN